MNETGETVATRASASIRALLAGAIDYAGLFPPASLDLATACSNFATYRRSADAWALGRFVIPAVRLDELAECAKGEWYGDAASGGTPWRISALAGADVDGDARRIAHFNETHGAVALVDSVEAAAGESAAIRALAARFAAFGLFVEIPLRDDPRDLLRVVGDVGAFAKVRTGGVVAEAIPSPRAVARFIRACAAVPVAFKATAGLHHPLRGEYALTYAAGSARGTMFGYLNVFAAAVLAREGAPEEELALVLEARDSATLAMLSAFGSADDLLFGASPDRIAATRASFALSFGSCSFREPLDDLDHLLQR